MSSFIVISAPADRYPNLKAYFQFRGNPFKEVVGRWKGQEEKSLVVFGDFSEEEVAHFAGEWEQECVLVVYADRSARLTYHDGEHVELRGRWRSVPEYVARRAEAVTYDPITATNYLIG